jgi:hypothetical protein
VVCTIGVDGVVVGTTVSVGLAVSDGVGLGLGESVISTGVGVAVSEAAGSLFGELPNAPARMNNSSRAPLMMLVFG